MAQKTRNNLPSPDGSAEVATHVGAGTRIVGRLSGQEDVRVHGTVEGAVQLGATLFVEPEGVLLAEVYARDVVVSGTVVGNVNAENAVVLTATARVVGDIRSPRVSIEPGAAFRGAISMEAVDPEELAAEASASRTYSGSRTASQSRSNGAVAERAASSNGEARRSAPARQQQQQAARLPPRRAQAFMDRPEPRSWATSAPPARPRYEEEDTIIVQHPAIRSDERPRRRAEALTAGPGEDTQDTQKKLARPRTLPRGKHKVDRVE